ncbi:hypothetical protein J7E73_17425 [Paenibacillus albidus]|nr:hypothetical protein [Paenibacillus albidus]MBT2290882.1 hypothetical protein [Paenibacillus albidus]
MKKMLHRQQCRSSEPGREAEFKGIYAFHSGWISGTREFKGINAFHSG